MRHIITGKNAVKYLLSTISFLESDIYESLGLGKLEVKEYSKLSRNVIILVFPNLEKFNDTYYVIKQVQRNDNVKIQSLRNEALYFQNINGSPFNLLNYDFENNILVYESNFKLKLHSHYEFETPEITGKKLAIVISEFHRNKSLYINEFPLKTLNLISNRTSYLSKLKESNDFSILETVYFIEKYESVFSNLEVVWNNLSKEVVLVHGDFKFPNLVSIVNQDNLVLIDFEMVGLAPRIYDISNFMFNYLRYIKDYSGNGLDAKLYSGHIIDTCKILFSEYFNDLKVDYEKNELEKIGIGFFYIMVLENFLNGSMNKSFSKKEKNLEYNRVQEFRFTISKYQTLNWSNF